MTSVSTPSSNDDILLCQGAEGKVYLSQFCQKKSIVKERLSKSYRVAELDHKINKQRMQQEVRCMVKCRRAGVCTPVVYHVDQAAHRMTLEFIEGVTVKQFLLDTSKPSPALILPPYHLPTTFL
jgi:TP53 regulating kinase-like protein